MRLGLYSPSLVNNESLYTMRMWSQITREHRGDYRPRFDLCPHDHASRASYPIPLMRSINIDFNPQTRYHCRSASVVGKSELAMMISRPGYAHEALRFDQRLLRRVDQVQRIYSHLLSSPSTEMHLVDIYGTVVPGPNHFSLCGTCDRFITLRVTADVRTRIG